MRSRGVFIALALVAATAALPLAAHAASIPFLGPIVPKGLWDCPIGWAGLIIIINNIILFALTILIVFVAPIMVAYAGFLLVVNSVNPGGKAKAKKMLLNFFIGLAVALAAWLIVDLVMSFLYDPSKFGGKSWSELLTSGGSNYCLSVAGQLNQAPDVSGVQGAGAGIQGNPVLCSSANTACSSATLASFGLSSTQADAMSCIAMTESAGGTNVDNGNGTGCNSFGYCGMYQLSAALISQFAPPDCDRNKVITNANNCNARTAAAIIRDHGYSDWTGGGSNPWNPKARSCVKMYDSSTSKPGFTALLKSVYDRLIAYAQII